MKILSLGTPLFSAHWRAKGHRVLVVADVALPTHEDNIPFDFFAHPDTCAQRFETIVDRFQPDLVFQGDHSTPLIHCGLEDLDIPKAWYSIDSHLHLSWHKHYAVLFDRLFVAQKNLVPHLSRYQQHLYWLPPFCQQTAEFMPWEGREHDVAFVGTLDSGRNPERVRLFDEVRQRGISLHLAGGAYRPVYRSSRIVINQAVKDDLNLRVFEAMGCGSLLVTDRISHSLHELYDEGSDYLAYSPGDADDCAEKIIWALGHPQKAEAIARSGHEKTLSLHCEKHRAAQVMETLSALAADRSADRIDDETAASHLAWVHDYCARCALPESLVAFFAAQADNFAAQGRQSVTARPWSLLVWAGQALNKTNMPLVNALLAQIPEIPEDREFRIRHACLCMVSLSASGKRAEAQKLADVSLREFSDAEEIKESARAISQENCSSPLS
jgi:hypothetical protein